MFNNLNALSKEDKEFGDYAPLEKGSYILMVKQVEVGETDERVWEGGGFVNTGKKIPQIVPICTVFKMNGSNEIKDVKGEIKINAQFRLWINESTLSWYKKDNKPKEGRAFLTAAFNIAPDAAIPMGDPKDLIGKKITCYLTVETPKDKNPKNKMMDPMAYTDAIPGQEDYTVQADSIVKKN